MTTSWVWRLYSVVLLCLWSAAAVRVSASFNSSAKLFPASFSPPTTFEQTNLVRNINLEKSYARETSNIVIKNIASQPQTEYYFLFPTEQVHHVAGFEVKDKKDLTSGSFKIELAQYSLPNPNSYFIIHLARPLAPSASQTLSISYALLSYLQPLPAEIEQTGQQSVVYSFSAYLPSAYFSRKQKTKVKLPVSVPQDYTKLENNSDGSQDPQRSGSTITYGPYNEVDAYSTKPVSVRYRFTKPLLRVSKLERDIEVSLWGGNLAVEERYWLSNRAARLKNQFSRVQWQTSRFANQESVAESTLRIPLLAGASDPYFIDEIGNVSTSRFTPGRRESSLLLRPRYPIYGGWNYSFKIGWNMELQQFLRQTSDEEHILKVPFMEGPRSQAGIEYAFVTLRIILPEGATNINFTAPVPLAADHIDNYRTFMDTVGRPTLVLTVLNAVEEWRDKGDVIVTYTYPWYEKFRKPVSLSAAAFAMFTTAWIIGNVDVRIGKAKPA